MRTIRNVKIWLVMAVVLLGMVGKSFGGKTIYVDDDAKGLNNGSSWDDAYKFLQDALADANSTEKPVEIRVAQGIYKPDEDTIHPDGTGDRTAAFQLINGVTLKGGYAGFGESNPNARDIKLYETILSGDLTGNDVDVNNPFDLLNEPTRADNCYHIFYHHEGLNLDDTAILNGFTITGGFADSGSWPHDTGSGMFNYRNNPTVECCTFSGNWAEYGGGMDNVYSSPTVTNCTFERNSAVQAAGGIYSDSGAPSLTNCTFVRNSALCGGAMFNYGDSILTDCIFIENLAPAEGAGGGAIINLFSSPTLLNCKFIRNTAGENSWETGGSGGAIYAIDGGNPKLINCTFIENSAKYFGGAISSEFKETGPIIINCTFSNNWAAAAGGISNPEYCTVIVINSIFWGNYDEGGTNEWAQVGGGSLIINYCCIQGWTGDLGGTGNTGNNPLLDSDNYHLLADSPCINAGDPSYMAGPNEKDFDGELRVMLGRVDMGADEFNPFAVTFEVVNKRRIERTIFEYDCNVTLRNISRFSVRNVQLEIVKASENMVIIEPKVTFGDVEIGAGESATSIDTCTFQVDRSEAIKPVQIVWKSTCQMTNSGQEIQDTASGMVFLRLENTVGDSKVDLAGLVDKWLWTGDVGSIKEDITGDGIVNLADLAAIVGNLHGEK